MTKRILARRTLVAIAATLAVWQSAIAIACAQDAAAEANFNGLCGACHTVGGGKRVGPDLQGVTDRRTEAWLLQFIRSSQTMVHSGDAEATALFNEFQVVMPDVSYSDAEIRAILAMIAGGWTSPVAAVVAPATPDDIRRGRELFQGATTLQNGGPSCTSCHHVTDDNVIGGGVLAKELTGAFTRLGAPGIRAILSAPPFPVMAGAYHNRPITDDEMVALVGYLQNVSERPESFDQPREDSLKLLGGGLIGLVILMGLYSFAWRGRKKGPVNQKMFDRQTRSE